MKTLFLTSNIDVTRPLFEWLSNTDGNMSVIMWNEAINVSHFYEYEVLADIGFIVSYNYSYVVKQEVISLFPNKIINLHISLLPWNRGAAPNIFSFLESTPCGVTIHEINAGIDTGDILLQKEISFDYAKESLMSSYKKSHELIQKVFKENWNALKRGDITPQKQCGEFTYHRTSDLEPYKSIIDYADTIAEFLEKAACVKI